jgi:hypothetical protein
MLVKLVIRNVDLCASLGVIMGIAAIGRALHVNPGVEVERVRIEPLVRVSPAVHHGRGAEGARHRDDIGRVQMRDRAGQRLHIDALLKDRHIIGL